eukprot:4440291-Amphidinium_carterae.1
MENKKMPKNGNTDKNGKCPTGLAAVNLRKTCAKTILPLLWDAHYGVFASASDAECLHVWFTSFASAKLYGSSA